MMLKSLFVRLGLLQPNNILIECYRYRRAKQVECTSNLQFMIASFKNI